MILQFLLGDLDSDDQVEARLWDVTFELATGFRVGGASGRSMRPTCPNISQEVMDSISAAIAPYIHLVSRFEGAK